MKLIFLISGQRASRIDKNVLVAGSENYVYGQVVLSEYVSNVDEVDAIVAVLWKDNLATEYYHVNVENGMFIFPEKYLDAGTFKMGFQIEVGTSFITTNQIVIDVKSAGYDKIAELDLYQQLIKRVDKLEERINILEKKGDQNDND